MPTPSEPFPSDRADVIVAVTAAFVKAAKECFPEIADIAGVDTDPAEAHRPMRRVISSKIVADETEFKFGSAPLHIRLLYDCCYPVIHEISAAAKRPLDRERHHCIRVGIWVEKRAFVYEFFAYAEIYGANL
jgi:hypothetical protein